MKVFALYIISFLFIITVSAQDGYKNLVVLNQNKIHIAVSGGTGYLTASKKNAIAQLEKYGYKYADALNYYKTYKLSYPVNAGVHYMYDRNFGIGISYRFFSSSAKIRDIIDVGDQIHSASILLQEKYYINYAGFSWLYVKPFGKMKRSDLLVNVSAGIMNYRNEVLGDNIPVLLTANAPGFKGEIGYNYSISPRVAVCAEVSYLYGVFKKLKQTTTAGSVIRELEKGNYENFSQIEFSLGLKYYL